MASRKKQRTRGTSPHPGVVLVSPKSVSDRAAWRAKYTDPDSKRVTWERVDPVAHPNEKTRREWAIRKAKELAKRRAELEGGAVRMRGSAISTEIDFYFEDHRHLREGTLRAYRGAADKFVAWCAAHGVESVDELDRAKLLSFRASLIAEPKRGARKGLRRGQAKATAEKRSPYSVNRELVSMGTVLGYLRKASRLPRLGADDIADGLERLPTPREAVEFLRQAELGALLEAALAHDAATFQATRREHAGLLAKGSTPRYSPVAPAIFAALMTGMRLGELVGITWRDVDLDALGDDGEKVGEIRVRAAGTKTGRGRIIDLSVSPTLRELLEALRPEGEKRLDELALGLSYDDAVSAGRRLVKAYAAPATFGWQVCRRTCGTFLTNAPGIFGAASAYRSARQLGHSVAVAEKHYLGIVRGIPREATTLEAAMGVESQARAILAAAKKRRKSREG